MLCYVLKLLKGKKPKPKPKPTMKQELRFIRNMAARNQEKYRTI